MTYMTKYKTTNTIDPLIILGSVTAGLTIALLLCANWNRLKAIPAPDIADDALPQAWMDQQ